MGATTSNVLQEYDEDDFMNMEYIRGGVLTSIPNEVKPRPRIGRNPKSTSKSNSKIKNESLRSALSVDLDNPEADKIRREFEMFRLNKENELANFKRKEKKLETENKKLKTELQALQKTCKKLRDERDYAFDAEQRALMRAAAIETDRDKVQRQFKIFRETKESELQSLLRVKRNLESKIRKVDPAMLENDDDTSETWTAVDDIIGLHSKHANNESTDHLVEVHNNNHHHHRYHDNLWHGHEPHKEFDKEERLRRCSNVVSVCWISCSDDDDDDEELIQKTKESIGKCCNHAWDHELNFVKVKPSKHVRGQGEVISMVTKYLSISSASTFLAVIFNDISISRPHNLKLLEEVLSFQFPINVIFCPSSDDDDDDDDDEENLAKQNVNCVRPRNLNHLQRLLDISQNKNSHSSASFSIHPSAKDASDSLLKLIEKKLRSKHLKHRIDCLNFMGWEDVWGWQDWQDELHRCINNRFNHHHHNRHHHQYHMTDSCFNFSWLDKYTSKITSHVSSPGPNPPLLVEGAECSGKTSIVMRWINECHKRSPSTFVLSYSLVDSCHPSSDHTILLKCLMFQMMQCFSTPFPLMVDPDQLVRDFPRWLDRVSALFPGGVVLVLDSIDRVKNFEIIFDWLMDPLPVDLRVIVTLRDDACPLSWRSWPLLSLDSMMDTEVREYVDLLSENMSSIDKEVTLTYLLDNPSLCLPLPSYLVAVISMMSPEGLRVFTPSRSLSDLYVDILNVLKEMDGNYREYIEEVLHLLINCRQGLTLSDLVELVGRSECDSSKVIELVDLMVGARLLRNYCGVVVLENCQVMASTEDWCHEEDVVNMAMQKLQNYHSSRACLMFPKSIQELAWIAKRHQDWETLKSIVSDLELCLTFLRRSMGSELVGYWKLLNYDLSTVVQKLHFKLEEYEMSQEDSINHQCSIAIGYELVGKFLADHGFHEEALDILQKCIEFHELDIIFGHLKIGRVSNLLGHIHDKLGRRNLAETLYLAALAHFESAMDPQKPSDINNNGKDDDDDDIGYDDDDDIDYDDDDGDGGSDSHGVKRRDSDGRTINKFDKTESCEEYDDDNRPGYHYHNLVAAQLELLATLHLKQNKMEMADNFLKRATNLRSKMNDEQRVKKQSTDIDSIKRRIEELIASRNSCLLDDLVSAGFEHELGVLYALIGRYKEAETFLIGSLVKRESLFPSNHTSVIQSLNSLLAFYGQSKQVGKVKELSERLLECIEAEEECSDLTLECLRNLAHVYQSVGRLDKTEVFLMMMLNSMKQNPSASSKNLASVLVNLAVVLSQQGKHQKAEPLYGRALVIFGSFLPPNHPRIIGTMKNLALSKYEKGDFEGAAKLYLHAIEGNQTDLPQFEDSSSAH